MDTDTLNNIKLLETLPVSTETIRDIYMFNNVRIYHDVTFPRSPFKPQTEYAVVDYRIPENENTIEWYCEEGYGLPMFRGKDCLDKAVEFIGGLD